MIPLLVNSTELEIFWTDLTAKTLILVNPTEVEIFWQDFAAKALVLVNPTKLEFYWQDFEAKAVLLVIPTELEIFSQDFAAKVLLVNPTVVDALSERPSTVSSPYMVFSHNQSKPKFSLFWQQLFSMPVQYLKARDLTFRLPWL